MFPPLPRPPGALPPPIHPMPALTIRRSLGALAACALLAACAGGGVAADDTAAADTSSGGTAATAAADAPASEADAPLGEADLDAYARALEAEVALLRTAVERRAQAKTGEDTLSAMLAATESETVPAAARQAGLDADRYRRLDDAFGRAVGARLQNPGMLAAMANPDTSFLKDLPADQAAQQRAQLAKNMADMQAAWGDSATYASVPPALLDRFKEVAAARLDALWRERFELRARAAGIAR